MSREINSVKKPPALPPKQKHLRGLLSRENSCEKKAVETENKCSAQGVLDMTRLSSVKEQQQKMETQQQQNHVNHQAKSSNIRSLVDEPLFSIEEETSVLGDSPQTLSENEIDDINEQSSRDIDALKNSTVRYTDAVRRIHDITAKSSHRVLPGDDSSLSSVFTTKHLDQVRHTAGKLDLNTDLCQSVELPAQVEIPMEENVSPYGMVDLSNFNKKENFDSMVISSKMRYRNTVEDTGDMEFNYDNVGNSGGDSKVTNWVRQKHTSQSREILDAPSLPKSTHATYHKNSYFSNNSKTKSKWAKHSTAVSSLDRHGTAVSLSKSPICGNTNQNIYEEVKSPLDGNVEKKVILDSDGKNAQIQEILNMIESPDITDSVESTVFDQFPISPEYKDEEYPQYDNFQTLTNDGIWKKPTKDTNKENKTEHKIEKDTLPVEKHQSKIGLSPGESAIKETATLPNRSRGRTKSSFTLQRFRSKSQEKLPETSADDSSSSKLKNRNDVANKEKSESRLSRRLTRKTSERRARSTERKPRDKTPAKSPARNPVNFIRKLLKKDRDVSDENSLAVENKDFQKAESTPTDFEVQHDSWTLPRKSRSSKMDSNSKKSRMRSPPSHRARKLLHSKPYPDSDSSSDEKKKFPMSKGNKEQYFMKQALAVDDINNVTSDVKNIRLHSEEMQDSGSASNLTSDYETSSGIISEVESSGSKLLMETKSLSGRRMRSSRHGINMRSSRSDPNIFPRNNSKETLTRERIERNPKVIGEVKEISSAHHTQTSRNSQGNEMLTSATYLAFVNQQRIKYKTLVSLNAQTLTKITQKWLSDWRNKLPVGGFLITSWSDIVLTSRAPKCVIENSPVYYAQFASNKDHQIACQLLLKENVTSRQFRQLENCSTLTMHPNLCIVCSYFQCKIPAHLFKGQSRRSVEALCVVLTSRPEKTLLDYLHFITTRHIDDIYKEILLILIQVMQALQDLVSSGFQLSCIKSEHMILTEDGGLVQILPHMEWNSGKNSDQHSSDFYSQEILNLIKSMLTSEAIQKAQSKCESEEKPKEAQGSIFLFALHQIMQYLKQTITQCDLLALAQLIQCALWGPLNLECLDVEEMLTYDALSLWIDMEQAKLVNGLAVLLSTNNKMSVASFLKYQYFSKITAENLMHSLKILRRV